jgi:hypothetical protein
MYKPPAFREGDQTNLSNIRSCVSELSLRSILGDLRNNDGFAPSFQSFEHLFRSPQSGQHARKAL